MEDQKLQEALPEFYNHLKSLSLPPLLWSQVLLDISDLSYLSFPPSSSEVFLQGFFSHIERLISAQQSSNDFHWTVKLNRVKVFIYDSLFFFLTQKEKFKTLCTQVKSQLKSLSFFKSSSEALSSSEDLGKTLHSLCLSLKSLKGYINESLILVSKPLQDEFDKDLQETIDEIFYNEVLDPLKTQLKQNEDTKKILKDFKPNVYFSSNRNWNSIYSSYQKIDNVYVGELSAEKKRHGYGRMYFNNLNYYEGSWANDKPDGKGLCTWKDGGKYFGDLKGGRLEGSGKRVYSNGNWYEGQFENGRRKGKGKMKFKNGDVYEGDWSSDEMHGSGMYVWGSGDMYVGEFNRDKKDGKGTLTLSTGEVYQGNWTGGAYKNEVS